jgi:hypothetical protein
MTPDVENTDAETDADQQAHESAYRCAACGRTFEDERALRDHVYSVGLVY